MESVNGKRKAYLFINAEIIQNEITQVLLEHGGHWSHKQILRAPASIGVQGPTLLSQREGQHDILQDVNKQSIESHEIRWCHLLVEYKVYLFYNTVFNYPFVDRNIAVNHI